MSEKKSPFILPQYQHLSNEYDAVVKCNRCGFCETVCPTYVATGNESLSPRGRNQAFRNILEGKLTDSAKASKVFSTCLTCHACTEVCFSQVPVGRLMGFAREISSSRPSARAAGVLFRILLFNRKVLSSVLWFAFLFKRTLIPRLLRTTGILKIFSPELAAAEEFVDKAPLRFGPGSCQAAQSGPSHEAALFSGCGVHYLFPDASKAVLGVLESHGVKASCGAHSCCGLIPMSAGDPETARKLAQKNVKDFAALGAATVVTTDDSCAGFMKDYPRFLDGSPEAKAFASRVKNLSEFLVDKGLKPAAPQGGPAKIKVTYHDPCQMGNGQGSFSAPREILKNLPGVEFVELSEANACCGGAGTYALKNPELAGDVLEKKLDNIKNSGADFVVTQAASCLLHIGHGLRKRGEGAQVVHLAEFLQNFMRGLCSRPDKL